MRMIHAVMALTLLLAACGEQKKDVKDTVFAPQVRALEKARAVENTLKQGAAKESRAIESSGNSETPDQK
jgi:protein involved in sex pheromone biosynthesis